MHVPQNSMWWGILKTFWFSEWIKQGLNMTWQIHCSLSDGCSKYGHVVMWSNCYFESIKYMSRTLVKRCIMLVKNTGFFNLWTRRIHWINASVSWFWRIYARAISHLISDWRKKHNIILMMIKIGLHSITDCSEQFFTWALLWYTP